MVFQIFGETVFSDISFKRYSVANIAYYRWIISNENIIKTPSDENRRAGVRFY